MVDLRGLDLNLLVSLDALIAQPNVTKAAEQLHISQPALSAQLAKLRLIFDDPLLLPAEKGRGMTLTARALQLAKPLHAALKDLEGVVKQRPQFDPQADERIFAIAASDNAAMTIGLSLVARLREVAGPQIKVSFRAPNNDTIDALLERGEIDLLIGSERMLPPNAHARVLVTEHYVMAQRADHPRGQTAPGLDEYCSLQHVLVSTSGGSFFGFMDEHLAAMNRTRSVILSVPNFSMVPDILTVTDYVSTLPSRLVMRYRDRLDAFDLPFPAHGFSLHMAWHPRNHHDPALTWLRSTLVSVVE